MTDDRGRSKPASDARVCVTDQVVPQPGRRCPARKSICTGVSRRAGRIVTNPSSSPAPQRGCGAGQSGAILQAEQKLHYGQDAALSTAAPRSGCSAPPRRVALHRLGKLE